MDKTPSTTTNCQRFSSESIHLLTDIYVMQIDPYLNNDADTMSPFELIWKSRSYLQCCFLFSMSPTSARLEPNLHYICWNPFLSLRALLEINPGVPHILTKLTHDHNITIGKIYQSVIDREPRGVINSSNCATYNRYHSILDRKNQNQHNIEFGIKKLGELNMNMKEKLSRFCHVSVTFMRCPFFDFTRNVISSISEMTHCLPAILQNIVSLYDVPNIWHIPLLLREQKAHEAILKALNLFRLQSADAIVVPGDFDDKGEEGKIIATKYACENNISYLGVCLGMLIVAIDYARSVLDL
ncbi:LOW QUALITY PROTEIN: hypothetical protein OSB04_032268 [Centaurea solstitialis]|uniref:CTP synthase (glutamine hydrolyzing) n=1 Tax=Centaurea solstitialis TaxID=347529 RepID=A0AA38SB68_9ASTR|nr:LOW QUALITY PROTEIN: hypothetical protein OSB04_032268 [Centaurea solstitialis]